MTRLFYNAGLLVGLVMIGAGVAMWSPAAALVVDGVLVIGLTVAGAQLGSR